jgi:hypothetical protein
VQVKTEELTNEVFWAMVRWENSLSPAESHQWFGSAFGPQGEDSYSWGTWWMNRAFDRAVEAARG